MQALILLNKKYKGELLMEKVKFKFGMLSLVLVFALAFAVPFWAGCGESDKDVAKTVISNAKTTITKMYTDAEKERNADASNEANTAPVFATAEKSIEEQASDIRKYEKLSFVGLGSLYPAVVQIDNSLALEMADYLAQNKDYKLGSVFTGTIKFDIDKTKYAAIGSIFPNSYDLLVKGKLNIDTKAKKIEFQASIVTNDENKTTTYLYVVLGYGDDKKITSYKSNYTTPSETGIAIFYSEGVDLASLKTTYIERRYGEGTESKIVSSDGSTKVDANANEISYADALNDAYKELTKLEGTQVGELAEVMKAAMKTTNDIFTKE